MQTKKGLFLFNKCATCAKNKDNNRKGDTFMMKKLLCILLAVAMVACLFACGNDPKPTDPEETNPSTTAPKGEDTQPSEPDADPLRAYEGTTLTFAHCQGEYIWEKFYEIGDAFEEKTGIKIEWLEIPSADWETWVTAQFSAGTEPDVIWMSNSGITKSYYDQGKVINLNNYINEVNPFNGIKWADCFTPGALTNCYSEDGKDLITLGVTYATVNLYANLDIMEELGLGDKVPTTWSEMVSMMKVAKDDGKYVPMSVMNSMGWNLTWIEPDFMDSLFSGTDVVEKLDIITPNGTLDTPELMLGLHTGVIDYEDPRFVEYFKLMKDMTQYYNEDYNTASWEYESLFNDGKALFNFNGGWFPGQVVEKGLTVNYAATQKPVIDKEFSQYGIDTGIAYAQSAGEPMFLVPQKTADEGKEGAAILWMQFLTDYKSGAKMFIDAVMLESCIANIEYPEEMAALADKTYGDARNTNIQGAFKFCDEANGDFWPMYTEYLDPASTMSAEDFCKQLKDELLPYLEDAIDEYEHVDILSYVDQVG